MNRKEPSNGPARSVRVEPRHPDLVDFLLRADRSGADALVEAGELYGDDVNHELVDLETGRHPVQRSPRR